MCTLSHQGMPEKIHELHAKRQGVLAEEELYIKQWGITVELRRKPTAQHSQHKPDYLPGLSYFLK